ncbi:sigma-70 family RNA polymerase sigma factor [Amycolatopsis australiensis]|nr:sigma-70 family RNA polymerase sigma factor [Amycolatopsis australiensis]
MSTSPDKEGNAMPNHQRSLTSLEIIERRFNELTAQPTALSLDGRVIGFGLPDRPIPLDELRITLLKRQTSNQVKNAVWSEVVRRAQEQGDPWTTAALGLMMPGLKKVAGSIARNFRGDIADFDAEIVEGFLQALNSLDPNKPMLYSSLRFMAHRYGLEARGKEDRINGTRSTYDESTFVRYRARTTGHPDLVLAQAVKDDTLTEDEASLIGRVRLDGEGAASVAHERGVSFYQFRQQLSRAERRLTEALTRHSAAA